VSKNFVGAGRRLSVIMGSTHLAGDLVYEKGFFGVVQDNVATAGALGALILDGEWNLSRLVGNTAPVPMGAKIYAPATLLATSLPVAPIASVGGSWAAIGRLAATSNASQAKVILFHPNESY
jgi:predicted RecA/RadA family phage recombinase